MLDGRNRPLLAIQTRSGLSGASMPPKLLVAIRNIKKFSYDCAGQLREHFVQFAILIYLSTF